MKNFQLTNFLAGISPVDIFIMRRKFMVSLRCGFVSNSTARHLKNNIRFATASPTQPLSELTEPAHV